MDLPETTVTDDSDGSLSALHALFVGADRRSFITNSLLAIGVAGATFPGLATVASAKAVKAKRFLDPARYAVLNAVSEAIMPRTDTPGARDALVPQRYDALMKNWASAATREKFNALLDEVEALARTKGGPGFAALPADKQLEVVAAFDKAKVSDAGYRKFKNLILSLYYISEPGATQELRYEHVPGAWEPSIPVTPDTRGYALDVSFGG